MNKFLIRGGTKLKGEIKAQGAKNEALQILCAVLLTSDNVTIKNIPHIVDVRELIELLRGLGVETSPVVDNSITLRAKSIRLDYLKSNDFLTRARKIRGSVMLLGPLLARFGYVSIPNPGGDKIGRRSLDTHFNGLIGLGAKYFYDESIKSHGLKSDNLKGKFIWLDEASVTGTANIIMAAVLAFGETCIYNAACEPYIQQLCRMLNSMGADIKGIGSNRLIINGVDRLEGCDHEVMADMIEVGSFIGLAAATNSNIVITNTRNIDLGVMIKTFETLGIKINQNIDSIEIKKQGSLVIKEGLNSGIPTISDAPWPGLTPDIISILIVSAIYAKGSVLIHQKMFESRLYFVDRLIEMGGKIILCDPHRALVIGNDFENKLRSTNLSSPDIRAGMALLIAAISANGTSVISNAQQIDRGYQNIVFRLRSIGVDISRID